MIIVGGILHDFTPSLPRALLFFLNLSHLHFFNWIFVKYGWAWNICLLLPLITLSAHALNSLNNIHLKKIEKSIEQYHEGRLKLSSHPINYQHRSSETLFGNGHYTMSAPIQKNVVSLQSISGNSHSMMLEQCQQLILNSANQVTLENKITIRIKRIIMNIINVLIVKDVSRLILCSMIYLLAIISFEYIQTTTSRSDKTNNGYHQIVDIVDSFFNHFFLHSGLAIVSANNNVQDTQGQKYLGLDISGHVFILIFSNLIFLEECNIMTGWEPLNDRLFDLSREYMNLEIDSATTGPPPLSNVPSPTAIKSISKENRSLYLAWHCFHHHTTKLRVFFLLCTLLTVLWDFMLAQTAFFYHSLVEKFIALLLAITCWYISYRMLFRAIGIEVRKPLILQVESL